MSATPEEVWSVLTDPANWSTHYKNAWFVQIAAPILSLGTKWSWVTFGVPVKTKVEVFEPFSKLGWSGGVMGATGFHSWLLEEHVDGCLVVTEEVQHGAIIWALSPLLGPLMSAAHDHWLNAIASRIASTR